MHLHTHLSNNQAGESGVGVWGGDLTVVLILMVCTSGACLTSVTTCTASQTQHAARRNTTTMHRNPNKCYTHLSQIKSNILFRYNT